MPGKIHTTILPPGWKVSDTVKRQAQVSTFKYHLNDVATLGKLKKHSVSTPMEQKANKDNSVSLQFSTGAYMKAVLPLIRFYKECEGQQIRKSDVDNLLVSVKNVETETDAGGKITGYLVHLEVEEEKVTVTLYDTQVNMRVQGKKQMEEYVRRALLPYLRDKINSNLDRIAQINLQFRQLGKTVMDRQFGNVQPFKPTRRGGQRFLTEQQLGESAIDASELEDQISNEGSVLNSSSLLLMSNFHPEDYLESRMSEFEDTPPTSPQRPTKSVGPASRLEILTLPRSSTPLPTQEPTLSRPIDDPQSAVQLDVNPVELEIDSGDLGVCLEERPSHAGGMDHQKSSAAPAYRPELNPLQQQESGDQVDVSHLPAGGLALHVGGLETRALEVHKSPPIHMPPSPLSPDAASFVMPKILIEPDLPWERILPVDWKKKMKKKMSKTIPTDVMRVLLDTIVQQELLDATVEEEQASVEVLTTSPATLATLAKLATPTSYSPVEPRLEKQVSPAVEMEVHRMGGGVSPAVQLEGLDFTKVWGPTHDTTGDLMRIHGEMRYQSERMLNMEQLINSQKGFIVALQQQVLNVTHMFEEMTSRKQPNIRHSRNKPPPPEHCPQPVVPQPRSRGPSSQGPLLPPHQGPPPQSHPHQSLPPQDPPLQDHPRQGPPPQGPPHQGGARARQSSQSANNNQSNKTTKLRESLQCPDCGHLTTNMRRMDNHIKMMHQRPHHISGKVSFTLLVGDSHLGAIKRRNIEKAMGRGARLVTPGATRPGEDRSYCSSADWPDAWFKQNSLVQMVPELLGERNYQNLIMMAPSNDISNLVNIKSQQEREDLSSLSARNTVYVAEQAMERFPSLKEVLIMEQPVRVDGLAELSKLSNTKLKEFARSSPLAGRIRIGYNQAELCTTEDQKKAVFGLPSSPKVDGVHMRGEDGRMFLTDAIVKAVRCAGLADRDSRLGGRSLAAGRLDDQAVRDCLMGEGSQASGELDGHPVGHTRRAGLADRDSRVEKESQPARGLDRQEQDWTRVERGPSPANRVDGQQQKSFADVTRNRFHTLGN